MEMRLFEGEIRMTTAPCISLPIAVNSALTTFVPGVLGTKTLNPAKSVHMIQTCAQSETAHFVKQRQNNIEGRTIYVTNTY